MWKWVRKKYILPVLLFVMAAFLAGQWNNFQEVSSLDPAQDTTPLLMASSEPITPIPTEISLDLDKVALGKKLFHDPQLSKDNSTSCASCHSLTQGATDRKVKSVGVGGQLGEVNAPSIFNSGFQYKQFWDGRAETLEEQIEGPIHNDVEMASSWPQVIEKLQQSSDYTESFQALYPDGMSPDAIKDAIATFEQSLYTPNSRFDQFLRGNKSALTAKEQAGYQKFKDMGCVSCHQGVLLGGNMFQKFGVFGDYFHDRGNETKADLGRFNVTGNEEDRYAFKVPSLRNITLTPPYFHDGSAATLDEAVKIMIKYQLGREADPKDADLILQFLNTLQGDIEGVS